VIFRKRKSSRPLRRKRTRVYQEEQEQGVMEPLCASEKFKERKSHMGLAIIILKVYTRSLGGFIHYVLIFCRFFQTAAVVLITTVTSCCSVLELSFPSPVDYNFNQTKNL